MENYWFIGLILIIYLAEPVPFCQEIPISDLVSEIDTSITTTETINLREELKSGAVLINTIGKSMIPVIKENSVCSCLVSDYSVNDIVVYESKELNSLVGHRIIGETDDFFILKGDNNVIQDVPVPKQNVLCEIPLTQRINLI